MGERVLVVSARPVSREGAELGTVLVVRDRIRLASLVRAPSGDETLLFEGSLTVPHPFDPPLDPVALGAAVVVEDAAGGRVADVTLPGGAYDAIAKVGWRTGGGGTSWRYVDRRPSPPGGIVKLSLKDLSRRAPGLVRVRIAGKRGTYAVDTTRVPLAAIVVLDPPTAATGQCGVATFVDAGQRCATAGGRSVKCR